MYKEISQLKKCTIKEKQNDDLYTKVESSDRIDFEKNQHAYKESVQRLKQEGIRDIVLLLWLT